MKEYLPLIIGIIWLVYTIYSKGKKKEAQRHHPGKSEEAGIPSILEQLFTNNAIPQPQPYETDNEVEDIQLMDDYHKVVNVPKEMPKPYLRTELANFMQEGQSAFSPSDNFIYEEIENEGNQDERQKFDLKKAIIFSEILNAPYIGYK